ncbi:MAG TPA: TAT-variant-translocated molybdopterin oxidoreductase [Verrucomicrobiae bacterium]|nr:TAT-variant-translocated molybdopterin oxidoreductase [Verrucomicrobiae bacterium]
MKSDLQHSSATGRRYWKGLDELAGTPEFDQWLHREFPAGASELAADGTSRRAFLQLMGASLGLAGLAGCRRPEAHIVPFTKSPEWMIPGRALQYATAMPRRRGAMPLLVTTFNGRPTKIEGNPLHPMSGGKTDTFAQASILDLYDPDRSRQILKGGVPSDAKALQDQIAAWRTAWAADGAKGVAMIADETLSPTRLRLAGELLKQFPNMTGCIHEPFLDCDDDLEATRAAFGPRGHAVVDFGKADVVLAIGSDFLGADDGTLADVREFSLRRRPGEDGKAMNRLYVAEHAFTITGGSADHRFRIPASLLPHFAAEIARELLKQGKDNGLRDVVEAMPPAPHWTETQSAWIRECAKDLAAHAGRCAVVAGLAQHRATQVLAHAINASLDNVGKTVTPKPKPGFDPKEKILDLAGVARRIAAGEIHTLFVLGANPAHTAPADLNFGQLLKQVKTVVHHGLHYDETAEAAHWHIPAAHYLESWGDTIAPDHSHCSIQPMILPLFGGWSQIQLLAALAGKPFSDGPEEVQETFRKKTGMAPGPDFDQAWTRFVHDGFTHVARPTNPTPGQFNAAAAASAIKGHLPADSAPAQESLEVVLAADYRVDDGRYINNGWMQEFPDPITKLTWENAALMSPATAKALDLRVLRRGGVVKDGVTVGQIIKIAVDGRTVEAPVLEAPGHADNSITLHLGYGRRIIGKVGTGSGFNAYALRTTDRPHVLTGAKIEKTGRVHRFAVTQEHHSLEGRDHVREAPLEHFKKAPDFAKHLGVHSPPLRNAFESKPFLTAPHQWAMAVDLSACTGCGTCMVACQAENNIPIVGAEQVRNGREMHWVRIDRYFTSHEDYSPDLGTAPSDPAMLNQPVMCQHCENAPCEVVCPVNATIHNEEGLNVMAYNRCVGTRYCANNCPYKVRRFNFFDYNQRPVLERHRFLGFDIGGLYFGPARPKGSPETLKLQKNPNVTVRMRGVMEKCTFCVQRLEAAKIDQKVKAGATPNVTVPPGTIQTACQQACPANAITFGNEKDAGSDIARARKMVLSYEVLSFLNTRPRVSYLAKIRNPNPAMPGAEYVGMSSLHEAQDHGQSRAGEHAPGHGGTAPPESTAKPHGGH